MNKLEEIFKIIIREFKIIKTSPRMVWEAFFQPLLYMLLFVPIITNAMNEIVISDKIIPYMLYVIPGISIFNAFTIGQYVGIKLYIEKITGNLESSLALPIRRSTIIYGKLFVVSFQTILETITLVSVGFFISPVYIRFTFSQIIILLLISLIFSLLSSLLFFIISCYINSQDAFNVIVNVITTPIVFSSTAFYPVDFLPELAKKIVKLNPLTYYIEVLRNQIFVGKSNILWILVISVILYIVLFEYAVKKLNKIMD